MTLDKLKIAARQHEQNEEWRAAIDLYREAIRSAEAEVGGADPALYNRIGDLEQKAGDSTSASEAWEQAAARYGEQGFFNNAIALCNKILRLDPGKVRIYLELARYHARKRVIYDVRQNLTLYKQQMESHGNDGAAMDAIAEFESQFDSWTELRLLLDELLDREPVVEEPTEVPNERSTKDLVFLDTKGDADLVIERASDESDAGIVLEHTILDTPPVPDTGNDVMAGLETTSFDSSIESGHLEDTDEVEAVGDVVEFEHTAAEVGETESIDGLEDVGGGEVAGIDLSDSIQMDGLEAPASGLELEAPLEYDLDEPLIGAPSSTVDSDVDGLVAVGSNEADPLGSRAEGHDRLDEGDRAGAIAKLEEALGGYQESEDWPKGWQVATELVEADPRSIDRHQTRVELAARLEERGPLVSSYYDLGEALVVSGAEEKAIAVFRRLLEIDENHAGAKAALRRMVPDAAPEQTADGFVDFGAMVNDDVGPRSTRMRTETTSISEDEDETFRESLEEFKRALDQNLPAEDYQTHYDLGLAFREMGLYDEAIGSFQKALRSPEGRLRTSEALGQCFFEQGRPAVAEAVLRAVEKGDEGDSEKIGVLYWLGRALEAQGKQKFAISYYERVLAVDVAFADASDRAAGLGK